MPPASGAQHAAQDRPRLATSCRRNVLRAFGADDDVGTSKSHARLSEFRVPRSPPTICSEESRRTGRRATTAKRVRRVRPLETATGVPQAGGRPRRRIRVARRGARSAPASWCCVERQRAERGETRRKRDHECRQVARRCASDELVERCEDLCFVDSNARDNFLPGAGRFRTLHLGGTPGGTRLVHASSLRRGACTTGRANA